MRTHACLPVPAWAAAHVWLAAPGAPFGQLRALWESLLSVCAPPPTVRLFTELDPNSSFVAETTTAVHQAVAHLNSLARVGIPHKTTFNRDVVACMVVDLWADVLQVHACVLPALPFFSLAPARVVWTMLHIAWSRLPPVLVGPRMEFVGGRARRSRGS